jgi:hypothetical protein
MDQDLLLLQNEGGGMDITVVDKWDVMKKRGDLWGHAQFIRLLTLHV